jgi:hypothetical protein
MNRYEEDARARKVRRIVDGILEVRRCSVPQPTLEETGAVVRKWTEKEWREVALLVGVNLPSQTSRDQVLYELDLRLPAPRRQSRGVVPLVSDPDEDYDFWKEGS